LGAAYVPTPFDYIPYNKDEKVIIDRVGKSNNIASFFYHPFLEFKHLAAVTDDKGMPVFRDGLPEYHYSDKDKSLLQKLIAGLKAKGYKFYSIQDYVPFTPSQSVPIQNADPQDKLMVGDVTGDGQSDLVHWDTRNGVFIVTPGSFTGMRNEPQGVPAVWAKVPYTSGAAAALDAGNQRRNLWVLSPAGMLQRLEPDNGRFEVKRQWKVGQHSCSSLYVMPQDNGATVVAGLTTDRLSLFGYYVSRNGDIKPIKSYKFKNELKSDLQIRTQDNGEKALFYARSGSDSGLDLSLDKTDKAGLAWKMKKVELNIPSENGEIRFGDYNGDGKEDILRWNSELERYTVYLRKEADQYELLSVFGPWGNPGSRLITCDLDGNGKTDLALINHQDGFLDTALSFESK
jgi:hypothetical protein